MHRDVEAQRKTLPRRRTVTLARLDASAALARSWQTQRQASPMKTTKRADNREKEGGPHRLLSSEAVLSPAVLPAHNFEDAPVHVVTQIEVFIRVQLDNKRIRVASDPVSLGGTWTPQIHPRPRASSWHTGCLKTYVERN